MKQTNTHRRESTPKGSGIDIVISALKSQIAVIAAGLILLLVFCAIASSMADPDSVIQPLSLCALFLSAFVGGFFAVRLSGDGLLSGVVSGIVTATLIFLLSVLPLPESGGQMSSTIISYLCIIASSCAGAVIGKRRTSKVKHPGAHKPPRRK